jgi:hypothetical protein
MFCGKMQRLLWHKPLQQRDLDGPACELFDSDLAAAADVAERETFRPGFWLHKPSTPADAQAAHPDLGPTHTETLASLGRNEGALPIGQSVADAQAAHPDRGPAHPSTLATRSLVAQILHDLGLN